MSTIYAEATPPGRGGISVVRLSGPEARLIGEALAGPLPEARRAELRSLRDGELIDRGLVIRFDQGSSFTGDEVVEFQIHGAPVVVRRLEAALRRHGARMAEPGEFTRRGLMSGAIALSEVEALSDLLSAESEAQRQQAMRVMSGELVRWTESLRERLVRAGALIEVSVDFADEEVPEDVPAEVFDLLKGVRGDILAALAGYPAAERIRTGFEVAIVGPPNAGKSSLLNRIARRELALVSDVAGTTRDVIELHTDLGGLAVTFLDTAGLRKTQDQVEFLGVKRALDRARNADLRIHLSEDGQPVQDLLQRDDLVLRTKADLGGNGISAVSGTGIPKMLEQVKDRLSQRVAGAGVITRRRQAECLETAAEALDMGPDLPPELLAEIVRHTSQRLTEVVGRIAVDDYLDEIFSRFCIGK
ncbi:tRNA uridine-5-carboxymethylaminomethyl(34) synthesis GTPase MnmE [Paracoccus sp. MC1862]|uniref:tRNA uridine-5-carboxymethylaminomethyl(34) synthesis GTPase MnmE n=1 Tax=Paracoccus sp. MC1862 TaxID=2760307 RepID=UPI0016016753|nr:tRNA uridine-5-carboxymethylaminomethyl(34) synthesis GTPase MnmE [Paracoccus sp. MC1862]MBB1497937.1 tRNA uridine-5-carboxymethylaminomethyl(34) synthesis GTPase MnmE [Paracoccus sp. MC1862]QQO44327.1 tRNA uridine-5-carboxymethylaminomethyl(34) synthesis GTPase MnmE [Paracoccus sp. MC1862]